MEELSKQDIADILYLLKKRKDDLLSTIRFFEETLKGKTDKRLEMISNALLGYKTELDKIELLILKIQNLL